MAKATRAGGADAPPAGDPAVTADVETTQDAGADAPPPAGDPAVPAGAEMKVVLLLTTWNDGVTTIAPGGLVSFPVAEAERLVAIGSASDPEAAAEVVVPAEPEA
jgi:hypothetical protein